jgi:hypothetical protein
LKKEPKENTKRRTDLPCSWNGRINIRKVDIILKSISRFNAMPIKIPISFIAEIKKSILKLI